MPYIISLRDHFKIWFSYDPKISINQTNKARLAEFRGKNPGINISLVFSSDLLESSAHQDLIDFAARYQIKLVDLPLKDDRKVIGFIQDFSDEDKKLYQCAREELLHLNDYGNPAVASDLLRFIFLSKLGIYADFDTEVCLPSQAEDVTIEVNRPFFWPLGTLKSNNDVLILASELPPLSESLISRENVLKIIKLRLIESSQFPLIKLNSMWEKWQTLPKDVVAKFEYSPVFCQLMASQEMKALCQRKQTPLSIRLLMKPQ